jgi:uncharacterized coiled-coil DUF342 family protein
MNRHSLASINILEKFLVERDKNMLKNKHVARPVPAESDQMKSVAGAFRERVESIAGDRNDVATRAEILSNVTTF